MSWVWHNKKAAHREPDWNAPVPDTRNARLEYLYAWERRCRGYDLYPHPVSIEPPFVPYRPGAPHELLSHSPFAPPATPAFAHIALDLPLDQKVTLAAASSFLTALPTASTSLAFEIVAHPTAIAYQLTCPESSAPGVLATAQMHWPRAQLGAGPDFVRQSLIEQGLVTESLNNKALNNHSLNDHSLNDHSFVVEFGLQQFAFLPLTCSESWAIDPLSGVLAGLGTLEEGEVAGLQILFAPATRSWNAALLQVAAEFEEPQGNENHRAAYSNHLAPFDPMQRAARAKLDSPLYAAVIRVFAVSKEGQTRAFALCKKIGGALGAFNATSGQTGNALLALANQETNPATGSISAHNPLPANGCFETVLERTTHRSGLLLSLPELAGLIHPPGESVQHPKLRRHDPNARSLSDELLHADGIALGLHTYRGEDQTLVWPDAYRNRHAYILGATRMGKSTLLLNMMMQDIQAGRGLCLIDPHGDLALDVLERIPRERAADTLYLDFSDREHPLALGLLESHSEGERRLLCSDLLSVLHRVFASSWGDRLEHILRHAILTLLAAGQKSDTPYTLRDIRPLLSNPAFRERIVSDLDDLDLKAFWKGEFQGYSGATFAPLYNKLGLVLSSPLVRNVIAGRQSKLSFEDVIRRRQILLVNLASSRIGSDNAHFLGALLVSKLQIAAMSNLRLGQSERTPLTLYVDEFQNFVVSSFQTILSEAGKAGLSLVMANQFLEQLSSPLQTAILSNAGTLLSFRVSSDSGRLLEKEFAGRFKSSELVSLHRGQAIARVGSAADSYDFATFPPPETKDASYAESIRAVSRERICRPREEVEAELDADARRQSQEQETFEREEAERKAADKAAAKTAKETQSAAKIKVASVAKAPKMPATKSTAQRSLENEKKGRDESAEAAQSTPDVESIKQEEHAEIVNAKLSPVEENNGELQSPLPPPPLLEPDCFGVSEE